MFRLLTSDFLLGFFALFVFFAASHSLTPTLPIYLRRLGSNEREIGMLIGTLGLAALTSRLFVGGALRKFSEKTVMMTGALVLVLTFLSYIIFRSFWSLLAVRFAQGVAFACIDTAVMTYMINVIPSAHRGQGLSYFMLAPNLAMSMAAPLGMFIINQYSFTVLFLAATCLSLCVFFLSSRMKKRTPLCRKAISGGTILLFQWKIAVFAVMSSLQSFVWGALQTFFPLYAIQCGVRNPGLFFSANAVMIITSRILGGRILDNCSKEKIILTFICTSMITLVILSFSKTLSMFIVTGLLWGVGGAFVFPACMVYALERAGSLGSTSIGTYQSFMDLGMTLGPVIMGFIIPLTGYRVMFLCLALICLINISYFQFYVTRRDVVTP